MTLDDRLTPNVDVKQLQKQDNEERDTLAAEGAQLNIQKTSKQQKKKNTRYNYSLHISIGKCAAAAAAASNTCPN